MTILKKHIQGNNIAKLSGKQLPICGKVSSAIEFDTISLEEFLKLPIAEKCVRCSNRLIK